jgi:hypothetical protein
MVACADGCRDLKDEMQAAVAANAKGRTRRLAIRIHVYISREWTLSRAVPIVHGSVSYIFYRGRGMYRVTRQGIDRKKKKENEARDVHCMLELILLVSLSCLSFVFVCNSIVVVN